MVPILRDLFTNASVLMELRFASHETMVLNHVILSESVSSLRVANSNFRLVSNGEIRYPQLRNVLQSNEFTDFTSSLPSNSAELQIAKAMIAQAKLSIVEVKLNSEMPMRMSEKITEIIRSKAIPFNGTEIPCHGTIFSPKRFSQRIVDFFTEYYDIDFLKEIMSLIRNSELDGFEALFFLKTSIVEFFCFILAILGRVCSPQLLGGINNNSELIFGELAELLGAYGLPIALQT